MSEATGPQRIQLRRAKGWRMPPNTVKVDRTTKWGNPFVVGVDGNQSHCVELYKLLLAGYPCLTCKATLDAQRETRRWVGTHLNDLAGRDLACWCRADKPCHADVLLKIANA